MILFVSAAVITFFVAFVGMATLLGLLQMFGFYATVRERTARVYILFGSIAGVLDEPGFHFLPFRLGWKAFFVGWLGRCQVVNLRLDEEYLRNQPVNSEEGAPMGIGIWYEMAIGDPVAYLFRNVDPRGSLEANVSNATVRCLSNLPLMKLLEDRHAMSQTVRAEVTDQCAEWGYQLGSIYIRKVHFQDAGMIRQIEAKVVNRLRQVTAAISQDGSNQVNLISSTAERQAAVEFAKATALRPRIVGEALGQILSDREVAAALFEILEIQRIVEGKARLVLMPRGSGLIGEILATRGQTPPGAPRLAVAYPPGQNPLPAGPRHPEPPNPPRMTA